MCDLCYCYYCYCNSNDVNASFSFLFSFSSWNRFTYFATLPLVLPCRKPFCPTASEESRGLESNTFIDDESGITRTHFQFIDSIGSLSHDDHRKCGSFKVVAGKLLEPM